MPSNAFTIRLLALGTLIQIISGAPFREADGAQAGFDLTTPGNSAHVDGNVHRRPQLNAFQDAMSMEDTSAVAQADTSLENSSTASFTSTATLNSPPSTASGIAQVQSSMASISTTLASFSPASAAPASTSQAESIYSSSREPSGPVQSPSAVSSPEATPLVMGYYPDWAGEKMPPEQVDFSKYDWVDFAFAIPNEQYELTWDDPNTAPNLLHRLVTEGHANGKKVKLSVGGWTGSKWISKAVASNTSRAEFVGNIVDAYHEYSLDGIDIDWEYPGRRGEATNEVSADDAMNFLVFLQELKARLPPNAKISAATQSFPFADPNGQSMQDVRQFGEVLDWILLMNYDVWGSSSNPGPNAPLYDGCSNSTQPEASAVAGYNAWTMAGLPPSKLVLGLPAYGYVSTSSSENLRVRSGRRSGYHDVNGRRTVRRRKSRRNDGSAEGSFVRVASDGNQVQFRDLIKQGVLERNTNTRTMPAESDATNIEPMFVGSGGFVRRWDKCSGTPFLTSPQERQVVAYDDTESMFLKAKFADEMGMLGVNLFDVQGDTDEGDLVNAIRLGFGQQ